MAEILRTPVSSLLTGGGFLLIAGLGSVVAAPLPKSCEQIGSIYDCSALKGVVEQRPWIFPDISTLAGSVRFLNLNGSRFRGLSCSKESFRSFSPPLPSSPLF